MRPAIARGWSMECGKEPRAYKAAAEQENNVLQQLFCRIDINSLGSNYKINIKFHIMA